jgi:sugar diacid utilization regulator
VEAGESGLGLACLRDISRGQAALFDRLLAAVSDEYEREAASRMHTVQQRRIERVERLLAGDIIDATALEYELDLFHVGVVGHGEAAVVAVRELAQHFDRRLLLVRSDAERFWAWLGSRRRTTPEVMAELLEASSGRLPPGDILAFGEPSEGFPGWRLTHQQAKAALPVARATEESVVRYSDVAMLASVLQDEVVAASLRQLYLDPLQRGADGGMVLRETLKAYFAAGGQSSSTAAALGVTRRTIRNRLKAVEERVGASVDVHAAEFRTALLLAELDGQSGQT